MHRCRSTHHPGKSGRTKSSTILNRLERCFYDRHESESFRFHCITKRYLNTLASIDRLYRRANEK